MLAYANLQGLGGFNGSITWLHLIILINIVWKQMFHRFLYSPPLTSLKLMNAFPSRYDCAMTSQGRWLLPHASSHWVLCPWEVDPAPKTGVTASRQRSLAVGREGVYKRCPESKCSGLNSDLCLALGSLSLSLAPLFRILLAFTTCSFVVLSQAICPCCCHLCSSWTHLMNYSPWFSGSIWSSAMLLSKCMRASWCQTLLPTICLPYSVRLMSIICLWFFISDCLNYITWLLPPPRLKPQGLTVSPVTPMSFHSSLHRQVQTDSSLFCWCSKLGRNEPAFVSKLYTYITWKGELFYNQTRYAAAWITGKLYPSLSILAHLDILCKPVLTFRVQIKFRYQVETHCSHVSSVCPDVEQYPQ